MSQKTFNRRKGVLFAEQKEKKEKERRIMPKGFEKCVKAGGKVVTKRMGDGKYIHLCKDKNGRWHPGEVKVRKKVTK